MRMISRDTRNSDGQRKSREGENSRESVRHLSCKHINCVMRIRHFAFTMGPRSCQADKSQESRLVGRKGGCRLQKGGLGAPGSGFSPTVPFRAPR
jgi:hypothetical protein